MQQNNGNIKGLSTAEVAAAREKYGFNQLNYKKENGFIDAGGQYPSIVIIGVFAYQVDTARRTYDQRRRSIESGGKELL